MSENNKSYILTDEEQKKILETLNEGAKQNNDLKILAELPSNNGTEEQITIESGKNKYVSVKIDPKTGESIILNEVEKPEEKDISEVLKEIGEKADNENIAQRDFTINLDDIKETSKETIIGEFDISDEIALELLNVVNSVKNDKVKVTFNSLPDQVKHMIEDYCSKNGVSGLSVQAKTIKNTLAETLIDEFINNISMNKYMDDFNTELENIYKSTGEEISPLVKEYNESRLDLIDKACEKIDDPEKKKVVEQTLDSINDAYELKEFIEAAKKIKIKKFYLEKPKKIFDSFHHKYNGSKYHIYNLEHVLSILQRHLVSNNIIKEDDTVSSLKVVIGFCLYCTNFKPENPVHHAFMYYFTYNVILLDIYKAEQYNQFADKFLNNIKMVLDNLR